MKIRMIPLTAPIVSPANVRKTGTMNGIAGFAANIAAVGLLQNLQVQKAASNSKWWPEAAASQHSSCWRRRRRWRKTCRLHATCWAYLDSI
jgi:hypothetical protein